MKKMTIDGEPPYLPAEIIRKVLKRLPVKSLLRFRCVCKDWKSLFKTSSFIADHLHHSHQNSSLLFECSGHCDPFKKECDPFHLFLVDRELQIRKVRHAPRIPFMFMSGIVDSSNGLICVRLYGTNRSLLVYNLALKEARLVPTFLHDGDMGLCVGFGFSPIVNDYKIVRLHIPLFDYSVNGVEVYSLSTGSWKEVQVGNLEGVALKNADGFSANGTIFWFGSKPSENNRHLIVSFDIAVEVFTLLPMPPVRYNVDTKFTVYENKLAILCPIGNGQSCMIELWVMEEDSSATGERERWSWTKKYSSNPYPCWLNPMVIWRNAIVCRVDGMYEIIRLAEGEGENFEVDPIIINLTTNEFKTFVHQQFDPFHSVFNHVESLVSLNNVPIEDS